MSDKIVYQEIARLIDAIARCEANAARGDSERWSYMVRMHRATANDIVRECMPSGAGIDNGTTLDFEASRPDRLVFNTSFHHMSDVGYYDGWTEHTVIVTPSLALGFEIRITGRDRNEIKDYLTDLYHCALGETIPDHVWEAIGQARKTDPPYHM